MIVERPIITSLLDTDLYKLTQGQVVFHNFPNAIATYKFFNRGQTKFPIGFAEELKNQINLLSQISLTSNEAKWLKTLPYMRPTYVEWIAGYRYSPPEVEIRQTNGDLNITIKGPWYRTILWEVPLMAIISELYFDITGHKLADNWFQRIATKNKNLSDHDCLWSDFGTRRRRAYLVQKNVVGTMYQSKGFLGTSNPHFAMRYGVPPIGTSAHEAVMAMSALVGPRLANKTWLKYWREFYKGQLGIALTDTFTTEVFLRDFDGEEARFWDGLRQDSGDPSDWMEKILAHYTKLGIPTRDKKFVFSDGLTDETYKALSLKYRKCGTIIGGIGTALTNDVGAKPLNIVIKLISLDGIDVVKLSDNVSKHTGNPLVIENIKRELNIL